MPAPRVDERRGKGQQHARLDMRVEAMDVERREDEAGDRAAVDRHEPARRRLRQRAGVKSPQKARAEFRDERPFEERALERDHVVDV